MAVANPGSVNRHLGGKIAARTRRRNDFINTFGADMLPGHKEHPKNIINGKAQFYGKPTPLSTPPIFGTARKFVCPNCLDKMNWSFKEEHQLFQCKNLKSAIPASPTTKFTIGSIVWVNGYGDCAIKTNRVQRTITGKCTLESGVFYKVPIGTNSTGGITYHHYPESRLTLIAPGTPPSNNDTVRTKYISSTKIIKFQKQRVRTRNYTRHPKLIRQLCRQRYI